MCQCSRARCRGISSDVKGKQQINYFLDSVTDETEAEEDVSSGRSLAGSIKKNRVINNPATIVQKTNVQR